MALLSQHYMKTEVNEAELKAELGWPEVQRGLNRILGAHLLIIFSAVALVGLVLWVATQPQAKNPAKEVSATEVIVILSLFGLSLLLLYTLALAVRGHWACLMHAPERYHAKWFIFAAILFRLVSPTFGFAAGILSAGQVPRAGEHARHGDKPKESATDYVRDLENYPERISEDDTSKYLMVTSGLVSLAADVSFILFLRAVARCFEDGVRTLLADIYLAMVVLLSVGGMAVQFYAPDLRTDPRFLLFMGGGWVLTFLWYLGMLVSTSTCIANAPPSRPSPVAPPA